MKQVTLLLLALFPFISNCQILDASFNQTGKNKNIQFKRLNLIGVAVSPDQSIIIAGPDLDTFGGHFKQVKVIKLKPDGTNDSSFGNLGITYFQFDTSYTEVLSPLLVDVQSNNKIVITAIYNIPVTGSSVYSKHFWTRLNSDGSLDTTYADHGIGGIVGPSTSYWFSLWDGIVLPNDDMILLLRQSSRHVIKLTSNGVIDSTFGVNGYSSMIFSSMDMNMDVKAQSDGKLLVYGYLSGLHNKNILERYNSNGSIDSSFGINGIVISKIDSINGAGSVLPVANGSIYCTGFYADTAYTMSTSGDTSGGFIQCLKSNGDLDTSFNHTGIVKYQHPAVWPLNTLRFVGVHIVNNKLIATGSYQTAMGQLNYCLVRFNMDGSLDSSFGTNGLYLTYETDSVDWCYHSIMQNPDKVLLIGESRNWNINNTSSAFIARYLLNFAAGITSKESDLNTRIECYPNPASNTIHVQYALNQTQEVALSIIDMNGRVVKKVFDSVKQIPQSYQYNIDVSDLGKNQLYILDLNLNGQHQTSNFVLAD